MGRTAHPWRTSEARNRGRAIYRCQVYAAAAATKIARLVRGANHFVKLLYGLVILRHSRRRLARIGVTSNPTAEWIAGQVTEAFPWDQAPRYLIRDQDRAYGAEYTCRTAGFGSSPASPPSPVKVMAFRAAAPSRDCRLVRTCQFLPQPFPVTIRPKYPGEDECKRLIHCQARFACEEWQKGLTTVRPIIGSTGVRVRREGEPALPPPSSASFRRALSICNQNTIAITSDREFN